MKLKESDYRVDKCDDCWRVTYINDDTYHSHIKSKKRIKKLLRCITTGKLPLDEDFHFYESLYRLYPYDNDYKRKVSEIMEAKKHKKDYYYNPSIKHKG